MSSWRLLGVGFAILLAGALVSLALGAPVGQTLMSAPPFLLSATPIVREFPVVTNTAEQGSPAISGNLVVWVDYRNGGWPNSDIYGKDLASGREFAVVTNTGWGGIWQVSPAISGNIVVWEDSRSPNPGIYGQDLATGREFPVVTHTASNYQPAISGNTVVWKDNRNGNLDIYGKDLASGREFAVVTNTADQWVPAISGNLVVWQSGYAMGTSILGKNLATGQQFTVATGRGGFTWDDNKSPAISGDIVVWKKEDGCRYGCASNYLYGKNLATGAEFQLTSPRASLSWYRNPAISGNIVVWEDWRNWNTSGWDIYGARLEWPPPPGACALTGTVRRQAGSFYLEEGGRTLAFLYGESVNFPAYLGQRVTVGGPCRVWRESAGPRPVFLAQTIISAAAPTGPPAKPSKGATRGW